jgi:uncharacterized protein YraI
MFDRTAGVVAVALASLANAGIATAQLDSTRRAAVVRAGPDHAFPQVARLPNGASLHIAGCVASRQWCDVVAGRTRGFLPSDDLARSARLRDAPTVAFSVEEYWDAHYRRRAWFATRDQWAGFGTPGFVAPRMR